MDTPVWLWLGCYVCTGEVFAEADKSTFETPTATN